MSTALLKEVQMVNYHSDITADEASEKKKHVDGNTKDTDSRGQQRSEMIRWQAFSKYPS